MQRSSHFANHEKQQGFKWQDRYGAFSVRRQDLDQVKGYIEGQKDRHRRNDIIAIYEPE